jgi:hypothetical protein
MSTIYLKQGKLDDSHGTGVTVSTKVEEPWIKIEFQKTYLEEEITREEYLQWKSRIQNPDYKTYFPGLFPGIGVVNAEIYEKVQEKKKERARLLRTVPVVKAREQLIRMGLDDEVEAYINTIEDPIEKKLTRNWYEYYTEWTLGHELTQKFAEMFSIDLDKFFDEASKL